MEPASPEPLGARIRQALENARHSFSGQDRYYKLQAGLVAGWAVISLCTVGAVAWTGAPSDKLGAEVRAEMAVGGPVLLVTNTSAEPWTDITYTLNGNFVFRQATLEPGGHLTVPVGRFRKGGSGGRRAPRDLEPRGLAIACEEGRTQVALGHLKAGP